MLNLSGHILGPWDADYDEHVAQYYVPLSKQDQLLTGQRFIVVGAQGTGKTALKKWITENPPRVNDRKDRVVWLANAAPVIDAQALSRLPSKAVEDKLAFWFASAVLAALAAESPELLQALQQTVAFLGRAAAGARLRVPPFDIDLGKVIDPHVALPDYVTPQMESKITEQAGDARIWLIVDDIDRRLVTTDTGVDKKVLEAGLLAAEQMSSKFKGRVVVALLLRTSIYDFLLNNCSQPDRVRPHVWRLSWSNDELTRFVSRRILYHLQSTGKYDKAEAPDDPWEVLFDASDKDELLRIQQFIFTRLINGPRDLLLLVDELAREAAWEDGKCARIKLAHLQQVEDQFGTEKLTHLNGQFENTYYLIGNLVNDLFREESIFYRPVELAKLINQRILASTVYRQYDWLPGNSDLLIDILYRIGVLGCSNDGGSVFKYHGFSGDSFVNTRRAARFAVHPALRSVLRLTGMRE